MEGWAPVGISDGKSHKSHQYFFFFQVELPRCMGNGGVRWRGEVEG